MQCGALPFPFVAHKDPRLFTVRRSTVRRVGFVAIVLAALGVGVVVGVAVRSKSSPPATKPTAAPSTTSAHSSTSTSVSTTTTTSVPAVLSCAPGSTPHVRPTKLTIGCANGTITVTGMSWKEWDASGGGQGTGTMSVDLFSVPAIVVVFHEVNGIFQDVSITPTMDLSTTTTTSNLTTVPTTGHQATTTTAPVTSTTASGPSPVVASMPGSGWGGE